jgi:lipoprotein-releasing system permease protein
LNTELFIAKKLINEHKSQGLIAQRMSKIAAFSISISITVMVVALAVVTGFKKEIREKVVGFSAPIQISKLDINSSYDIPPVSASWIPSDSIRQIPYVKSVHPYTIKAGIIKTATDIQGILLKGVDRTYDWDFFRSSLVEGKLPDYRTSIASTEVLISKTNAAKLHLKVGDKIRTYFVQNPPRSRAFKVVGIYDTKFQEFDSKYVISDLRHTQKLNQWDSSQFAGYEVTLTSFAKLDQVAKSVNDLAGYKLLNDGSRIRVDSIKDTMSNIFDWLSLQDTNAFIVLALMIFVAGINMITGILILLLDRVKMIGVLKAIGMSEKSLRNVFIYLSSSIIAKGLLWGNLTGITLCLLQKYTGLIKLEESTYYLSRVPIGIELGSLLTLNIATFVVLTVLMLIPLAALRKISPAEIIRYE